MGNVRGDEVNTAARFEALAKEVGEALLASEETDGEAEGTLKGYSLSRGGVQRSDGKSDQLEVFGIRWSS